MNVGVYAYVGKDELLEALRSLTLRNRNFEADKWSLSQAEDLIAAGEMIKREIAIRNSERNGNG